MGFRVSGLQGIRASASGAQGPLEGDIDRKMDRNINKMFPAFSRISSLCHTKASDGQGFLGERGETWTVLGDNNIIIFF